MNSKNDLKRKENVLYKPFVINEKKAIDMKGIFKLINQKTNAMTQQRQTTNKKAKLYKTVHIKQ